MSIKKIVLTNEIRTLIREGRLNKGITIAELSKSIDKTDSYISAIEKNKVTKMELSKLETVFMILFDLEREEATKRIYSLLDDSIDINPEDDLDTSDDQEQQKVNEYKTPDITSSVEDQIKKLITRMNGAFIFYHEKNPDDAEKLLKTFISSMRFDLGFMIVILKIPFFALKALSHEERQSLLTEIYEIFKKYALLAKSKSNEEKADE